MVPVGYEIRLVDATIEIIGHLRRHALQRLVQLLDVATQEKRYTEVGLDFSRCDGVTEAVMLPFTALVVAQRHQGVNFQLQLPDGAERSSLSRLFQNTNWAGFIDPARGTWFLIRAQFVAKEQQSRMPAHTSGVVCG